MYFETESLQSNESGVFAEVLLCRQCGHNIVDESEVVDIKSTLALKYKNASVLGPKGTLVQTFRNPQGLSNKSKMMQV